MPVAAPDVLSALQRSLSLHLAAIEAYQTISSHLARWGYSKLGSRFASEAEGERVHLRAVLSRLEYFDQGGEIAHAAPVWPRHDVPGILAASLDLENGAAAAERNGILISRAAGDEGSALVFVELLKDSEQTIEQITADLQVIADVGLDNWLANLV